MPNQASERLKLNTKKIMDLWLERATQEIAAARQQNAPALKDSLPLFLTQLSDALSMTIDRTRARIRADRKENERVGKLHGRERARVRNYTIDQLIFEYHILREVLFDVMEENAALNSTETETILCAIEQAVNDAATEFSNTLGQIQEQLSETLVHDLRSPITVAKLNAELQLRHPENKEAVAKTAAKIVGAMNRLDSMIRDLLDISRLKASEGASLRTSECDLNRIVTQIVDEFNDFSGKKIIFESSPGPVSGNWSEDSLRRVIENLVTNAVKYGAPETPVRVALTQTPVNATLTVHNEGAPIPREEQDGLFEIHHRSQSAEKWEGWGIGLVVVKRLTEAQLGTVRVESAEGMGTTFVIELPKNLIQKAA